MGRGRKLDFWGVHRKGALPRRADLKFALVVIPVSVVAIAVALYVVTRPRRKPLPAPAEVVVPLGGEVRIPVSRLSGGGVKFFKYQVPGGVEVRFFVVEAPSKIYRAALDASRNASASFHEHGRELTCTHCGLRFDKAVVAEATGNCFPIPLPHRITGEDLVISVTDLEQRQRYFSNAPARE